MSKALYIDETMDEKEIYESILSQIPSLILPEDHVLSSLSNFCSVVFNSFKKISWAGFYLLKNDELILGPFQGKTACTKIGLNNGVCGLAASSRKTIVVPDVNKFPGHITCDSGSKSEIVLPIIKGGILFGVFDVDSYEENAFKELDKELLEKLVLQLINNCNFGQLSI